MKTKTYTPERQVSLGSAAIIGLALGAAIHFLLLLS